MKKPANLQMDDERVGLCTDENYDPEIVIGPPTQRFRLFLDDAKKLHRWIEASIRWAEWKKEDNARREREEARQ